MADDFVVVEPLPLSAIRATLIRLEETIIFGLIERAQFAQNSPAYDASLIESKFGISGYNGSFFDYFLQENEAMHARFRRYTDPTEHPFSRDLPAPIPRPGGETLPPCGNLSININDRLLTLYRTRVLPFVCASGDDGQYGSALAADVPLLQAISRRIHVGKGVAEAKWQAAEATYRRLASVDDWAGIESELTAAGVEAMLLKRVRLKAATYGADPAAETGENAPPTPFKIDPAAVVALYKNLVIPLTKEVEVRYLLRRAGVEKSSYAGAVIDFSMD